MVHATGMQSVALFYLAQQSDAVSFPGYPIKTLRGCGSLPSSGITAEPTANKQDVHMGKLLHSIAAI